MPVVRSGFHEGSGLVLTTANIMLTALRVSEAAESVPEDCVRQILFDLEQADEPAPSDMETLRRRVAEAFFKLSVAGLLDPDQHGRCTLTSRGRRTLQEHPKGIDSSVLEQFPEYRRYLREQPPNPDADGDVSPVAEPKAGYFLGYAAYLSGRAMTENPYASDSVSHLEWENGWSEARAEGEQM